MNTPVTARGVAKREPKLTDICANCRKSYGKHATFGDWCPSTKRGRYFGNTKWKAK